MRIGFDLTSLDDIKIRAMRRRLRDQGIPMKVDARENDRYLYLEAPSEAPAFQLIAAAKQLYKEMALRVVVWHEELGEYIDEERFHALRNNHPASARESQASETHGVWNSPNDRDPLSGDLTREDF